MILPPGVRHPASDLDAPPGAPSGYQINQAIQQMEVRQETLGQTEAAQRRAAAFGLLKQHLDPIRDAGGRQAAANLLQIAEGGAPGSNPIDAVMALSGIA